MSDRGQLLVENETKEELENDPKCIRVGEMYGQTTRWGLYDQKGISPTLVAAMGEGGGYVPMIQPNKEETFVENKYEEFIKEKGYVPEMFNPYNKTEIQELAPTQTSCCGSNTSSSTVLVKNKENEINKESQLRIRKLTPKECWRLMGFTDEEFEKAEKVNSNSQLYKQAGNSIVVNVLEKILANLLK